MFILSQVEIDGFWGTSKLNANLNPDVNIFIGQNGTGKTTLINLLQACLTVDLPLLERIRFSTIRLKLKSNNKIKTISIIRGTGDKYFETVSFKIGRDETLELPLIPRDIDYRRRMTSKALEDIQKIRDRMASIVQTSWLSVHRSTLQEDEYELALRSGRTSKIMNPVDSRLMSLRERLTAYQLSLQSKATDLSTNFQKNILQSILYDPKFDTYNPATMAPFKLDQLKAQLEHAYSDLGLMTEQTSNLINQHIKKLDESFNKIKEHTEKKIGLQIDDVLPLSLYSRTSYIASLSTEVDRNKNELFSLFNAYINTLSDFINDKKITPNTSAEGGLEIKKGDTNLDLQNLSSGEKQLLILLTEILLQRQNTAIFIADEPELSLHVSWQRNLLSAIRSLNENAQIIVATHSPEIAAFWESKMIDMEDILL